MLLAAIFASSAAPAGDPTGPGAPVFGYLDPATLVFTPDAANAGATGAAPLAATAPVVIRSTLVVTVNVNFAATFPASGTAQALVSVKSVPAATANPAYVSGASRAAAIAKSGLKGTAVVTLPLSLSVSSAADTLSLTTSVSASNGDSASSTETIPIPANGTTKPIAVTQRF